MASSTLQEDFDLSTICDELGKVETKWFKIGVRLGIPRNKLKQFKKDEDPLSAVVDCCLQGNATKPFSWHSIVEALKSDYVGEPGLAEQISKKYCQKDKAGDATEASNSECAEMKQEQKAKREGPEETEQRSLQQGMSKVDQAAKPGESSAEREPEKNSQHEDSKSGDSPDARLDPKVKKDLEFILEKYLKEIINKYGCYVDTLRETIEEKGVSPEALRAYLLSLSATSPSYKGQKLALLSDKEIELEKCNTVTAVFTFLITKCASFLNYEVFQSILDRYKVENENIPNYPKHLNDYIKKHKISEFVKINPLLKNKNGSKELILKFDIETTESLAKISDLTKLIAEILDLNPSALQIVDIEEGCVVVTFLISSFIADAIFTHETVFTPQQQKKFRAASALWLKCNGHIFDFEVKPKAHNAALKKIVTCSICLDRYTDPKLLQCLHAYCQQCLQGLLQEDQQGHLTLTCPTCRQATPVPANGVAGLQADFRANQLLEIVDEGEWKEGPTAKPEDFRVNQLVEIITDDDKTGVTTVQPELAILEKNQNASTTIKNQHDNFTPYCPDHDEHVMDKYCKTCGETTCLKCVIKGGKHYEHNHAELSVVCKSLIPSFLTTAEKALDEALTRVDARCDEISNQQAAINEEIHTTDIVDQRKTELTSQLNQLTKVKLKSLKTQKDELEQIQANLHSIKEIGKPGEEIAIKIKAVRNIKKWTTTIQSEVNTRADMMFTASPGENCQLNCQIYEGGSPDPSNCYISWKTKANAHEQDSTIFLHSRNSNNQACNVSTNSITCEAVSEAADIRVRGNVEKRGQSQYDISYNPTVMMGKHHLHVAVEGQHIRGSPFLITEKGIPILMTISGVKKPHGVAINHKGQVVVIDHNIVTLFSSDGKRLGTFDSGEGQFQRPLGVAVDGEDNILVADTGNHRIQKFTAHGEFIKAVGTKGNGPLKFNRPCGITFNTSNGRVYVVDSINGCIQILNPDLSFFGTFGKRGRYKGQFNDPQYVTCDRAGNVYVTDWRNNFIHVFTAEGKFLRSFKRCGESEGDLNGPFGVSTDSSDRIYISGWGDHRVSVYTFDGQFVTSFGSEGKEPGQFSNPRGIAVDCCSGVVYVCDCDNNRLQIFPQLLSSDTSS